jgi:hypothetical protein
MMHKETDWELYNLQDEPGEKNNLAKSRPEIVNRMAKMILEIEKELDKNKRPVGIF